MRIQICGSMTFAKEMRDVKKKLESLGHVVTIPLDTEIHISDPEFTNNLISNLAHCIEEDVIRANFNLIAKADAILVLNFPKNDINGYIGASTLMEIGIAHFLEKKIFILNAIPDFNEIRWAHEVTIMQPVILKGDLTKIK